MHQIRIQTPIEPSASMGSAPNRRAVSVRAGRGMAVTVPNQRQQTAPVGRGPLRGK